MTNAFPKLGIKKRFLLTTLDLFDQFRRGQFLCIVNTILKNVTQIITDRPYRMVKRRKFFRRNKTVG
jgi:hypothetical protein